VDQARLDVNTVSGLIRPSRRCPPQGLNRALDGPTTLIRLVGILTQKKVDKSPERRPPRPGNGGPDPGRDPLPSSPSPPLQGAASQEPVYKALKGGSSTPGRPPGRWWVGRPWGTFQTAPLGLRSGDAGRIEEGGREGQIASQLEALAEGAPAPRFTSSLGGSLSGHVVGSGADEPAIRLDRERGAGLPFPGYRLRKIPGRLDADEAGVYSITARF